MASFAAQMLDELMGRNRNRDPNENRQELDWSDSEVCKYHLCGFCPTELFTNTRADLGSCTKIHDDELTRIYQKSSRCMKMGYEEDFLSYLQDLIGDVDRRIRRGHARLALNAEHNAQQLAGGLAVLDEKIRKLSENINEMVEKAENLGCEGMVDEAQSTMKLCEKMKEDRVQLESHKANLHKQPINPLAPKEMEVCGICGAFLVVGDAQQRVEEHLQGKQHLGYARVRETIEAVRKTLRGEDPEREARLQKEREERERQKEIERLQQPPDKIRDSVERKREGSATLLTGARGDHYKSKSRGREKSNDKTGHRSSRGGKEGNNSLDEHSREGKKKKRSNRDDKGGEGSREDRKCKRRSGSRSDNRHKRKRSHSKERSSRHHHGHHSKSKKNHKEDESLTLHRERSSERCKKDDRKSSRDRHSKHESKSHRSKDDSPSRKRSHEKKKKRDHSSPSSTRPMSINGEVYCTRSTGKLQLPPINNDARGEDNAKSHDINRGGSSDESNQSRYMDKDESTTGENNKSREDKKNKGELMGGNNDNKSQDINSGGLMEENNQNEDINKDGLTRSNKQSIDAEGDRLEVVNREAIKNYSSIQNSIENKLSNDDKVIDDMQVKDKDNDSKNSSVILSGD